MEMCDREAIEQILGGNRDMFALLVDRHQDRLRRVLSSFCGSMADVEEFVQETFVQAYLSLEHFDTKTKFFSWLKGIAMNTVRMEFRREQRQKNRVTEYVHRIQMLRSEDDEDGTIAEDRARALDLCVKMLRSKESEIVKGRYEKGQSMARLAKRFRTTVGAMKVRLLRVREALGDCIRKRMADFAEGESV